MTTTIKTNDRGCRDFPAQWSQLTRDELKRAMRLAVRLGTLPDSQLWSTEIDIATCEHSKVASRRQKRIREAFTVALGVRPLQIDTRSGGRMPTTEKYRTMLRDNPENRGLRSWCRKYVARWGKS